MEPYLKYARLIDNISEWAGRLVSYLVYPLIGGVMYEVMVRYIFNAPTQWAYDVTYMLYGTIFMLGRLIPFCTRACPH
jgi:TRAP-type mannitol/chloroaromatic compound transport system permease small subunit